MTKTCAHCDGKVSGSVCLGCGSREFRQRSSSTRATTQTPKPDVRRTPDRRPPRSDKAGSLYTHGDTGWYQENGITGNVREKVGRRTLFRRCPRCNARMHEVDRWQDAHPDYPQSKPYRTGRDLMGAFSHICTSCGLRTRDPFD